MTTSEKEIKPAEPDSPITGTVAKPPTDPRQLEQEIERTREQMGQTVQELVARVDLKSRARAKATEVSGKVRDSRGVWMPAAAAAAVIIVGFTALWEWSRRSA